MNIQRLKEAVYKVPLDKLTPCLYYDQETGCGCLVGHLALLNGVSPGKLIRARGERVPLFEVRQVIRKTYDLPSISDVTEIEHAFDLASVLSQIPWTHDDLWDCVKIALDITEEGAVA